MYYDSRYLNEEEAAEYSVTYASHGHVIELVVHQYCDDTNVELYWNGENIAHANWEMCEWKRFHVDTNIPENFQWLCNAAREKWGFYIPTTGERWQWEY